MGMSMAVLKKMDRGVHLLRIGGMMREKDTSAMTQDFEVRNAQNEAKRISMIPETRVR